MQCVTAISNVPACSACFESIRCCKLINLRCTRVTSQHGCVKVSMVPARDTRAEKGFTPVIVSLGVIAFFVGTKDAIWWLYSKTQPPKSTNLVPVKCENWSDLMSNLCQTHSDELNFPMANPQQALLACKTFFRVAECLQSGSQPQRCLDLTLFSH